MILVIKKCLRLFFFFILIFGLNTGEFYGADILYREEVSYSDFDTAEKKTDQRLLFEVVSTKFGFLSSTVPGYVKNFLVSGNYDAAKKAIKEMTVTITASSMDTDNSSRDKKLHTLCLEVQKYPQIIVKLDGEYLIDKGEQEMSGKILIRGKEHPLTLKLKAEEMKDEKQGLKGLKAQGETVFSLAALEIPDPSIAIAKLDDAIKVFFNVQLTSLGESK